MQQKYLTTTNIFTYRLKTLRKSRDLSEAAVARGINISQQSYHGYETGKNVPPYNIVYEICKFFDKPFEYFVAEDEPEDVPMFLRSERLEYESIPEKKQEPNPAQQLAVAQAETKIYKELCDKFFARIEDSLKRCEERHL